MNNENYQDETSPKAIVPRTLWVTTLPREILEYILTTHVPSEDHGCTVRVCREFRAVLGEGPFSTRVFASRLRCTWAHAQGWRPHKNSSFRGAAETDDLEVIEHVWHTHVIPGVHGRVQFLARAYRHACSCGNIPVMEWMEGGLGLDIYRIAPECIRCAATGGQVEMAEWVFQRVPWMTVDHLDDALVASVRNGHVRMMQWLLERPIGSPHLHLATRQAAFYAKRELLQWLVDQYPLWALLRDPDHTSFHVSATFIRVYLLRSRDVELIRCGAEWGIFATLLPEYLHTCIYNFFDLFPTHQLPDLYDIHTWIEETTFSTQSAR